MVAIFKAFFEFCFRYLVLDLHNNINQYFLLTYVFQWPCFIFVAYVFEPMKLNRAEISIDFVTRVPIMSSLHATHALVLLY